MIIERRRLALPALAVRLLGIVPAFAGFGGWRHCRTERRGFPQGTVRGGRQSLGGAVRGGAELQSLQRKRRGQGDIHRQCHQWKIENAVADLRGRQIRVVGTAAIVRFHWTHESEAVADGKKSGANLHILMNWQKQGADWKLLSRAATKL